MQSIHGQTLSGLVARLRSPLHDLCFLPASGGYFWRSMLALVLVVMLAWSSAGAAAPSQKDERAGKVACPDGSTANSAEECPGSSPMDRALVNAPGLSLYLEYRKRTDAAQEIAPLESGLFGEQVSLYNGSTEFSIHDIEIAGNASELPLLLSRRLAVELQPQGNFSFYDSRLLGAGNWDVDVPHLSGTYPSSTGWRPCSQGVQPTGVGGAFTRSEVWQGVQVHVPGTGDRRMLGLGQPSVPKPTDGATYRYTTIQRDMFDCVSLGGGAEGFRMTTSSGLRYYFTVAANRTAGVIRKRVFVIDPINQNSKIATLARRRYYLLASKIEDRHGNTIQYAYNSSGHPTRIWANDGREILLAYTNGRLSSATTNGRTWQYQYVQEGDLYNLSSVILPDSSKWQYAYTGNLMPHWTGITEVEQSAYCETNPLKINSSYLLTVTHPAGAVGQFVFANRRHWRSGVAYTECGMEGIPPDDLVWNLQTPNFFDVMSLESKTISGPGIQQPMAWSYDYGSQGQELFGVIGQPTTYPCTTCDTEKTVVVTQPDGHQVHHRFGIQYWANEGRELGSYVRDAQNVIRKTEVIDYLSDAIAPQQAFYGYFGGGLGDGSDPSSTWVRPVVKRTITQQGRSFVWEVASGAGCHNSAYCFDLYAHPLKVTRSSVVAP